MWFSCKICLTVELGQSAIVSARSNHICKALRSSRQPSKVRVVLKSAIDGPEPAERTDAPPPEIVVDMSSGERATAKDFLEVETNEKVKRSKISMASSTGSQAGRNGREISETFSNKMYEMKWCIIALAANILLLIFIRSLPEGVVVNVSKEVVANFGGVFIEIILLISNIMTIKAMDDGFEAFFGNVLCSKGVSMAVCGFAQSPTVFKLNYSNELSLNSTVRKTLVRLSYFWIIAELLKILTPLPATALLHDVVKTDFGTTTCIEFHQEGSPIDRRWPTLSVEAGVAEFIFGASIGVLRSQETIPLDNTTAVVGPQLLGSVNDGDTIVGSGYIADIFTTCKCTPGSSSSNLTFSGFPDKFSAQGATIAEDMTRDAAGVAMVTAIEKGDKHISITTILVNSPVCGGLNVLVYPICKTVINNHKRATIEMQYMTDGTPASIAQERAKVREIHEEADIEKWMYQALLNLFGGEISQYQLPPTVPGILNPLLYWTSSDLMSINVAMLEAGLETTFTILLRAAMQRSYGNRGNSCIRYVIVEDMSHLAMRPHGIGAAFTALIAQLIFTFASIGAFIPWIMNESPAGPAIRAVKENVYFTTLLADSNFSENLRGLCNAPTFAIWQGLDLVVRVGESVESMEDDVGHITMDKPKLVRPLINGRKYV